MATKTVGSHACIGVTSHAKSSADMTLKACLQAFLEFSAIRSFMNALTLAHSRMAPLIQKKHVTFTHVFP